MVKCDKLEVKYLVEEIEMDFQIPDFLSHSTRHYCVAPDFKFLNVNWHLKIDPSRSSSPDDIAVHLEMGEIQLSYNMLCTFGIKKADGSVTSIRSVEYNFTKENKTLLVTEFLTRSALEEHKSELLPSDTLTLVCKLKNQNEKMCSIPLKETDTLSENFKDAFTNKELCDITLQLPDKEFQAHKIILAARSPVFAAMFKHEMSEKLTRIVKISDCDAESFEVFLEYLYCGELVHISAHNVHQLYKTSDKYNVQKLKMFCVQYMVESLDKDNFYDTIVLAENFDETELFSAAQNFFNRNLKDIFASDKWKAMLQKNFTLANKLLLEMATKVKVVD